MDLLIVGASARAAAHSARRAGLRPASIDLFADADTHAAGPTSCVEMSTYPESLFDASLDAVDGPFLYTGALENHPDVVDRIAATRPLWGNPGATLRAARDPARVVQALTARGLSAPEVRLAPGGLPADGSWLAKPLRSAGGRRIHPYRGDTPPWPAVYQRRLPGPSLAAIFIGRDHVARLMGVTAQVLGGEHGFTYRGSVGPLPISSSLDVQIAAIGDALASAFDLVGLFGVDLILADGVPVPVEVNPRYTASVEVLELATGRSLLAEHARAFGWTTHAIEPGRRRPSGVVGKRALHAEAPLVVPEALARRGRYVGWAVPSLADVPRAGTRIEAGQPVMTLLGRGATVESCLERLRAREARWRRRLAVIDDRSC